MDECSRLEPELYDVAGTRVRCLLHAAALKDAV